MRKGTKHSPETIADIRQKLSGKNNPQYGKRGLETWNWKGGVGKNQAHQTWEDYWRQKVPKGYEIHHVDRNRNNNSISNLAFVTGSYHAKIHKKHYNLPHIKKKLGIEVED